MNNIPEIKIGIVAVSRDCFPMSLSANRRAAVVASYEKKYGFIYECPTCVENEVDMKKALSELKENECDALVVYLGNFGPETPETLLAKEFSGPVMFVAAAEETKTDLIDGRGDAYCGMLNASYNLKLREIKAYIPEYPVGTADECADMIHEFATGCPCGCRSSKFKNYFLWSPSPGFSGMQRADQAVCMILVLKLKKILSWICLNPIRSMPVMSVSPES